MDFYKRDVDRSLLRQALQWSPDLRLRELLALQGATDALRQAGRKAFR